MRTFSQIRWGPPRVNGRNEIALGRTPVGVSPPASDKLRQVAVKNPRENAVELARTRWTTPPQPLRGWLPGQTATVGLWVPAY